MKLLDFAKTHGAEMLPAISESRINKFEAERGLKLPPGLRDFYLSAGGTGDFTKWMWRIWPFEELTTIESRAGSNLDIKLLEGYDSCPVRADYLAFIDMLIELPLYAVCTNPTNKRYGEVISLAGDRAPYLYGPTKSFSDFEIILAQHWDEIILPTSIDGEEI